MNKVITIIKSLLLIILLSAYIIYFSRFSLEFWDLSKYNFLLILVLIVLIFLHVLDIKQKNKHIVYNLLFIFIELIMIFVFGRTLYDPNFIANSLYYKKLVNDFGDDFDIFNATYLLQNVKFFVVMLGSLVLYRKINRYY